MYNSYSLHLSSLKTNCGEKEINELKEKLNRLMDTPRETALKTDTIHTERRADRVLERLEHSHNKIK